MTRHPDRLHPRERIGFAAYYFLYYTGHGFVGPFLPLYWRAHGFSYAQIGVLLALASAPGALALVFIGALSDRLGTRRPFIVAGSALTAACFAIYPFATTFAGFAVLQAILGIGSTTSMAVTSALGADVFPPRLAGRSFASVRSWGTVGFILTMIGLFVHPLAASDHRSFTWTACFHFSAIAGVLMVRRTRPRRAAATHPLSGAGRLLSDRNVLAFVGAFFLAQFALMAATTNISLYLNALRPRPPDTIVPLAYGFSAGVELPFMLVMGWAADRFGRRIPLAAAFIVLPLRLLAAYLLPTATAAVALQALHGMTFAVIAIVPFAFMADVTPREHNATGQAVLMAANMAALSLGPLCAGWIAGRVGIHALYLWLAVVAAVGSCVFFAMVREPRIAAHPDPQAM